MTEFDESLVMGVSSKWTKRKALVKMLREISERKSAVTLWMDGVAEYNARHEANNPVNSIRASIDYDGWGSVGLIEATAVALEGGNWIPELVRATARSMFSDRLRYFWHGQFGVLFQNHERGLHSMSFVWMTQCMAFSFLLGWKEQGIYQGHLAFAALNRSYQLEQQYTDQHKRAHVFMLRLFADWEGSGLQHDWPPYGHDQPIYNGILEHWRTPDPEILRPWLLAACDRHTHEARFDTSKTFYDFGDQRLTRTPIEILLVFRLREYLGLANPVLDHPLMEAPFDQLPEPQPAFEPDEYMQGTLKRVREDWPQFDALTSLEALK